MATSLSQTVFSPWLTPVRLVSTSNIAGTYSNGPNNNGVGATLTIAATSLTIDSVACAVGDRVLLQTQTNTWEQGIYIVKEIDATVVLERSSDQQSTEQMKSGQYTVAGAGTVNAGSFFTLVEPLPNRIGVDSINFMATPSSTSGVSFSGGASTANALAVFSNTSGDIKAASAATSLGQALSVTGALSSLTGSLVSGASGTAGTATLYPATAANGTFVLAAGNAGGAFNTTLTSGTMGQSTTYTIPDAGNAVGGLIVSAGAAPFVSGNFPVNSGTDGLMVDSGVAAAQLMRLDAANTLSGSGQITLVKANGTEVANAVTASGNAGVITTSSLTTAGAASYVITWTNALITATSVISLTIQGGTNTVQNLTFTVVPGAGSATLTIYNTSTVADATPLNGTIAIGYTVF